MNHENDWNGGSSEQPTAQDDSHATPASAAAHPLADNNFDVGAFIDVVKLTFDRAYKSSILKALVALSMVSLAWGLFSGSFAAAASLINMEILTLLLFPFQILLIPVFILIGIVQYTLCRPLAQKVFDASTDVGGIPSVIKGLLGILPMVFVTYLLISCGSMITLCLAPITIFVLCQAPYLVAVHDRGVIKSIEESFERTKKHWHVLVMFAGSFIAFACVFGGVMIGMSFLSILIPVVGALISNVIYWFAMLVLAGFSLIVGNAAFMSIDELEGIATIDRS